MVLRWAEHGASRGRVVAVEPPTRFAYRWAPFKDPGGEEPVEGNSTLVEFTLQPEGDGTRLRVVESGFASLATVGRAARLQPRRQHQGLAARDRRAARVRGAGRGLMSAPAEGVFAALADPTRWRVLSLLAERGEGTASTPQSSPHRCTSSCGGSTLTTSPVTGSSSGLSRTSRGPTTSRGRSGTMGDHWRSRSGSVSHGQSFSGRWCSEVTGQRQDPTVVAVFQCALQWMCHDCYCSSSLRGSPRCR